MPITIDYRHPAVGGVRLEFAGRVNTPKCRLSRMGPGRQKASHASSCWPGKGLPTP